MKFMDWDTNLVFNPRNPRLEIYVVVYDGLFWILNFKVRFSSCAASQIQCWFPTMLFFFRDFF